jgi:lipopolysaccharide export system protein LptC
MRNLPGFSFPLALLVALALLSTWLKYATELPDERNDGKARHDPDYWIEGVNVSRYDQTGALQHTFKAPHWQHFPDTDTSEIESPAFEFRRSGQGDTRVSANHARLTGEGDVVELTGAVRIEKQQNETGSPPWVVATEQLTVVPDAETARTKATVQFTQGASRLTGTGLTLDNRKRQLELHADVNGSMERKRK